MNLWPPEIPKLLIETPGGRRWMSSTAMSFVLHAMLFVVCGFWLLPAPAEPRQAIVNTVWSEDGAPDSLEEVPISVNVNDRDAGGASEGTAIFEHAFRDIRGGHALDVDQVSGADWPAADPLDPTALTGAVSLSSGGDGLGTGIGSGDGASTFFGSAVEGKRVIYVVDASRSMNHPHPGPMLTRFGRVKYELVRSISQMTPEQEFFIVYFNDRALPMPSRSAVHATKSAQQKYLRWAALFRADGFTNPEQALALALRLNPDVIYFLTDGQFPAKIVNDVTRANQSRVIIHTIGIGDDEGEKLLKAIAGQNGGEYRFIPEAAAE